MATITPENDQEPIVRTGPMAVETPKRGRGRPPKVKEVVDPESEENEGATPEETRADHGNGVRTGSNFRAPKEDEDFWEWLARFNDNEWNYLIAYLWRVSPKIDLKANGKPSSICKFSQPFDQNSIMEQEGSGHYRVDVCRINPSGKGSDRLAQSYFLILNMKYPPNVPPGDWLLRPENKEWAWAAPMIEANAQAMAARARPGAIAAAAAGHGEPGGGNTVAMFTTFDQSMQRVLDMANPANILSTMRQYHELFAPPPAPAADHSKPDPMMFMVGMLREELANTRAEMTLLRNTRAETAKPQSLREQIGDLKGVLGDLRELSPRGAAKTEGSDGPNWENVAAMALPELSKITGHIVGAILGPKNNAGPQQLIPTAAQPQPGAEQQQQPQEAAPEMNSLFARLQANAALLYKVVPILADHFENRYGGTLETAAQAFQEWMFGQKEGRQKFDVLRKTFTVDEIFQQVTTVPALKAQFTPIADVKPFLEAVYADWEDDEPTTAPEGEVKS